MRDVIPPVEEKSESTSESPRRMTRLVGIALIITSVVLGWLLLITFLAYQSGQRQLLQNQEEELLGSLERQTELAAENMAQANYELALRRLEWVLARQPDNRQARALRETAQAALNQSTAPSTAPPLTPTAVSEPTPTPGQITSPEEALQRIRRLSVNKAWVEAVSALITFQQQFPSYEREETDQLLFEAYLGYGRLLLDGPQVEQGLFYLERAAELGDLPLAMLEYQTWGRLYTQGISFYGVNWSASAYYFRDLCLAAPFYQDACTRLTHILIAHGDQYALMEEWCPAQLLYEEAARQSGSEVTEKLNTARAGCLAATPTPITGTIPITGGVPFSDTESAPGSPFIIPAPAP